MHSGAPGTNTHVSTAMGDEESCPSNLKMRCIAQRVQFGASQLSIFATLLRTMNRRIQAW